MRIQLTLILMLLVFSVSKASKVDTVSVFSKAMNKEIKNVIIVPENANGKSFPTIYLLHGYSGNYSNWVNGAPAIKDLSDKLGIVFVCPDGGFSSWYWDVPGDKNFQYETYVAKELVSFVESKYPVIKDKSKRGITGLSMGGHGALYLAIKHQDVFSSAASTAGGVDIRPFPNNWDMSKKLGEYSENPEKWNQHTVIEMTHLIKPNSLALFIDCGTEDFFYDVNCKLHEKLTYLNIKHHFLSMPGAHNMEYWKKAILFQIDFFKDHFDKSAK